MKITCLQLREIEFCRTSYNHPIFIAGVDSMERGALLSMMSLAISDLLFCLVTVCGANLHHTKMIYYSKSFAFYFIMYSNCIQNILIKTSTWCTVILAVGRYFVVCHPITARNYLRCKHTIVALILSVIIWICLHIPLLYVYDTKRVKCPRKVIYILNSGLYENSHLLKMTCTYTWFLVGFVIPVCVLGYCNIRLIYSLRISKQLRSQMSVQRTVSDRNAKDSIKRRGGTDGSTSQRRLTSTLFAIIILFFVCFFPSEVITFYEKLQKPQYTVFYRLLMEICNLLQAISFSGNFVLYCIVNGYFRRTLKRWARTLSLSGCTKPKSNTQFLLMDRLSRKQYKASFSTKHSIMSTSKVF